MAFFGAVSCLTGNGKASASVGFRKRYPSQGSVSMYSGRAGLFSMFLRRALIYVRKYSASSQYSLPPKRPQDPGMGERDILVLHQKGQ